MNRQFEITSQPEKLSQELVKRFSNRRFFLLTDRQVGRRCLPVIRPFLPSKTVIFQIPTGELNKNLTTCEQVWNFLSKNNADRHSVLLVLGGGVVCDLGGFCASVFKRGIDFVLIPTTLLAMADAAIGGKTGIDFRLGKNQIGTFRNPSYTWVLPHFLKTLPEMELKSGFAEIVKHSIIADPEMWNHLRKRDIENQNWDSLLAFSQKVKQSIIDLDPLEKNVRQKLNAGHTVGHAIESHLLSQASPVPHGFAIAAGLVMEAYISFLEGVLSEAELNQIEEFIFSVYGKLNLNPKDAIPIWKWMQQDKKNKAGKVLMALAGPIGNCQIECSITFSKWERAFAFYLGNPSEN